MQGRPKPSVLAVVAKAGRRHASAKQPVELSGIASCVERGTPVQAADWLRDKSWLRSLGLSLRHDLVPREASGVPACLFSADV